MKIEVYRDGEYNKTYKVNMADKNLEILEPLTGFTGFINFEVDYNKVYLKTTEGKANCRFEEITFNNPEGKKTLTFKHLYCKLNRWQRFRMYWMLGETIFQKNVWQIIPILISVVALLNGLFQYNKTSTLKKELQSAIKKTDSISSRLRVLEFQVLREKEGL
jgi:hypothetical protein